MSIYIVQGPRILGCWGRGWHRTPGKAHPTGLSASAPRLCPPGPRAPPQVFTFCSRKRMKRVNNKTLRCEVNRAVRSVGRAGAGALWAQKKGLRRVKKRKKKKKGWVSLSAGQLHLGHGGGTDWGGLQACEASRRRCRAQAGPGGAA